MALADCNAQTTRAVEIKQMKDIYHTFIVKGDEKNGWYIQMSDVGAKHAWHSSFIGSKNNVRHWKKKELAERHAQRLRDGVSKISTA